MIWSRPRVVAPVPVLALALGLFLVTPPAEGQSNNSCANATPIPGGLPRTLQVSTASFAPDGNTPPFSCNAGGLPLGRTAWFTFKPAQTDDYRFDTRGTTSAIPGEPYDTILEVFSGSCSAPIPLPAGCGDDSGGNTWSAVTVRLEAGTAYLVVVSGKGSRDPRDQTNVLPSAGGTLVLNAARASVDYVYQYLVPSVSNLRGNALFVSDLVVSNIEGAGGKIEVQFQGNGQDGTTPASQPAMGPLDIGPLVSREFVDVVGAVPPAGFGLTQAFGGLVVRSTRRLLVGARSYTNGSSGGTGTYGQFTPAVDISAGSAEPLGPGQAAYLSGIRNDGTSGTPSTFRTNVVLANDAAFPCGAVVELRNSAGASAGAASLTVPARTIVQKQFIDLFPAAGQLRNVVLVVSVPGAATGCRMTAVAYELDNETQDSFAVPLRK